MDETIASTDASTDLSLPEASPAEAENTVPHAPEPLSVPSGQADAPNAQNATAGEEDFARMAEEDLAAIREEQPSCRVDHLAELPYALRFAELRELGLSVREALAAAEVTDGGKFHLRSVRPRASSERPSGITHSEMTMARELLGDTVSDSEIRDLYRRVTR